MKLTERAMLVTLNMRRWTARKHDKTVSREVADKHQSDISMGRFNKLLIAKDALQAIDKIHTAAYNKHAFLTLPWTDRGFRILGSGGYFDYANQMRVYQNDWEAAVGVFVSNYDQYVSDARGRLNGLFNALDYPARQHIGSRFGFEFSIQPVPDGDDFRVDLGAAETELIRQQITASVQHNIEEAMQDVWGRLSGVVSHMAERLRAYTVTPDGAAGTFRNSLVTNITELLAVIPALNITGDATIDQFAADIRRELTAHDPDTLRDNEAVRNDTARRAEEILAKMQSFIA